MPTYKIARKRGGQEEREVRLHKRVRLAGLVISGLLLLATGLLFYQTISHPSRPAMKGVPEGAKSEQRGQGAVHL